MPYLVEVSGTLTSEQAADALADVFVKVASEAVGLAEEQPANKAPFDALREHLNRRRTAISDWKHPTGVLQVSGGDWDRGEIETNLRQIEIIALALRTSTLRTATDVVLNPTQQAGFDAAGRLGDEGWVLEAFGGVNVKNNDKLNKDAESLAKAPAGTRRFFACRPDAWPWRSPDREVQTGRFTLLGDPRQDQVRLYEFLPSPQPS